MGERIKSALFVDFDNIFIGLKQDDPRAAEEFGRGVKKWLRWVEDGMPLPGGAKIRDVLVRRCYGNPETFADYRGYFTRNAFAVVDCPPLTRFGKNSADIVMVMDILDVLGHPTQFDEFIIMSGDADFTPVVLRLRMHDRRTVAIVAGNAAAAYTASCDLVVTDDEFVERALRLPPVPAPRTAPRPAQGVPVANDALLDAIARRVYEEASANGEVPGARLPEIFREFKEFTPNSNWLGFFGLRALTEALVARTPDLRLSDDEPWKVVVDVPGASAPATGARSAPAASGSGSDLRARIVEAVQHFVRNADGPVVMARVAQHVVRTVGPRVLETRWAGEGTFRHLLDGVNDLGLEMVSSPQPGYIYDPARHTAPEQPGADTLPPNLEGLPEELVSFIRRIGELTDTPRLSPRQYQMLFEVIAKEAQRGPIDITNTSRAMRDQMLERGETVSRQYSTFVLRGILFAGYRFQRSGIDEAPALARAFLNNVLNLLRGAQVVLTQREHELLREWLLPAGHEQPSAESSSPAPERNGVWAGETETESRGSDASDGGPGGWANSVEGPSPGPRFDPWADSPQPVSEEARPWSDERHADNGRNVGPADVPVAPDDAAASGIDTASDPGDAEPQERTPEPWIP